MSPTIKLLATVYNEPTRKRKSANSEDEVSDLDFSFENCQLIETLSENKKKEEKLEKSDDCLLHNCFDFEQCRKNGFKIFIHQNPTGQYSIDKNRKSENYAKILQVLEKSYYRTLNESKACIKILPFDTIDRDVLSQDYVDNMDSKLKQISNWNNGRNYLIFNFYSGTWPDYLEDLGFNLGHAILAKSSISSHKYRHGFDISLPLWLGVYFRL